MVQLSGIYDNGTVTLDKPVTINKPVKVMVTFMDDDIAMIAEPTHSNNFSFAKGREILKDLKSSLSDALVEERRNAL